MLVNPSTPEIKIKEITFLELQNITLYSYTSQNCRPPCHTKYLTQPTHPLLQKLQATSIFSFKDSSNKVVQALSYVLLATIYSNQLDEQLLKMLKLSLYDEETNLLLIQKTPFSLSNNQMKKLIVQFFFELSFSDFNQTFDKKLQKHPIILEIMSIFIRSRLVKMGLQDALSFSQKVPLDTVVELISDLFDLNYRKNDDTYLFMERNIFLCEYDSQILVGKFGQNKNQSDKQEKININPEKFSSKEDSQDFERQYSNKFDFNKNNSNSEQSSRWSADAPTPFFFSGDQNFNFIKKKSEQQLLMSQKAFQFLPSTPQAQPQEQSQININGTPSVCSIDEKLLTLWSPAISDKMKNKNQNLFQFATAINEELFLEQNQSEGSQSLLNSKNKEEGHQCQCKKMAKLGLKLNSNIISLTVQEQQQKKKPTNYSYYLFKETFKKVKERPSCQTQRMRISSAHIATNKFKRAITKTQESQEIDSPANFSLADRPFQTKLLENHQIFSVNTDILSEHHLFPRKKPQIRFFYNNK